MHKKLGFGALIAFLFAVVLSFGAAGCSLSGLSPAGSASVLNLSISAPVLTSSSGRAVFSDSMVMYIRTVGGPSGGSGPMYGPYTLSGSKFTTTDLPSGAYDNMGIVCFGSAPAPAAIQMLASATDAEVVANDKSGTSLAGFDALCDGYAVAGLTGSLALHSGDNSVAVTLKPLCCSTSSATLALASDILAYSPYPITATTGRFIKLDLSAWSNASWVWKSMNLTCTVPSTDTSLVLYNSQGKQLPGLAYTVTNTYSISSYPAQDTLYLYVKAGTGGNLGFTATGIVPHISLVVPGTFATVGSSSPATKTISLKNSDSVPHTVTAITLSAYDPAHWNLSSLPTLPVSIPANDSSTSFDVVCSYGSGTPYSTVTAKLTVTSDDPDDPTYTINLSANLGSG